MLKRFENLGTALSRNESKMVVGGDATVLILEPGDGSTCIINKDCTLDNVAGTCRTSQYGCYCSNGLVAANFCYG